MAAGGGPYSQSSSESNTRRAGDDSASSRINSRRRAVRSTAASSKAFPTTWTPTGIPIDVRPNGTETAGKPASDAKAVRKSLA